MLSIEDMAVLLIAKENPGLLQRDISHRAKSDYLENTNTEERQILVNIDNMVGSARLTRTKNGRIFLSEEGLEELRKEVLALKHLIVKLNYSFSRI